MVEFTEPTLPSLPDSMTNGLPHNLTPLGQGIPSTPATMLAMSSSNDNGCYISPNSNSNNNNISKVSNNHTYNTLYA